VNFRRYFGSGQTILSCVSIIVIEYQGMSDSFLREKNWKGKSVKADAVPATVKGS